MTAPGRRTVPHTADLRLEAWGPTLEACVEQAVLALVESFVDPSYGGERATRELRLDVDRGAEPADVLVAALDEVVYLLDVAGEVPLEAVVVRDGDGVVLRLRTAPVAGLAQVGAVPKAVSLHGLHCAPGAGDAEGDTDGWTCAVTIDV